jgi:hypothetical protein
MWKGKRLGQSLPKIFALTGPERSNEPFTGLVPPMGIRETFKEKPGLAVGVMAICVLVAGGMVAAAFWPDKKANLSQAFYTDDDGATWFPASSYLVAPFPHDGKTAVVAEVYSYDDGKKPDSIHRQNKNLKRRWPMHKKAGDRWNRSLYIRIEIS